MEKSIAIILNTSWNIYNFRIGLLKALHDEGYHIVAIAPRDDYTHKLEEMGIEYHEVKMDNGGMNPFKELLYAYRVYKILKATAPVVTLNYTIKPNIFGTIGAWFAGVKVISNISGLGTLFVNRSAASLIGMFLYAVALRIPHRVFFQNTHDQKLFVKMNLVNEFKTDILPGSGVDTEKFKPIPKGESDKISFLFIARLVRDKGIGEFVEAARKIKQGGEDGVSFLILGDYYEGNPTAITPAQMKSWEDEGIVKYLGHSDDVASFMANADCVVLPSYREGMSKVLLESASMARPIVTTNVPGCKEIVDDGLSGYLCEARDSDSLAQAIMKMVRHTHEERETMGQKGREKIIAEFSERFVIDKYKKVISEIVL